MRKFVTSVVIGIAVACFAILALRVNRACAVSYELDDPNVPAGYVMVVDTDRVVWKPGQCVGGRE